MSQATLHPKAAEYIERIERLYKDVETWMKEIDPQARIDSSGEIELNEEGVGIYKAPTLVIPPSASKRRVQLSPKGCNVLGTAGRVDIETVLGREILVLAIKKSECTITTTISEGEVANKRVRKPSTRRLANLDFEGWAWFQDKKNGDILQLNKGVFKKVLKEIS